MMQFICNTDFPGSNNGAVIVSSALIDGDGNGIVKDEF